VWEDGSIGFRKGGRRRWAESGRWWAQLQLLETRFGRVGFDDEAERPENSRWVCPSSVAVGGAHSARKKPTAPLSRYCILLGLAPGEHFDMSSNINQSGFPQPSSARFFSY